MQPLHWFVPLTPFLRSRALSRTLQWFSSGTAFSEYAEGGYYKMTKADKRENIILVSPHSSRRRESQHWMYLQIASEPLTFEKGIY
jgi:glutamine amidotransferase